MPFRKIQSYRHEHISRVVDFVSRTLPSGESVDVVQDQSKIKLPDSKLFDITNLMDSGVDLQEVNSKVMNPKSVNAEAVVRKYTKKTQSTEE